eukprot:5013417-Amphidinium_carterae.1
MTMQHVIHTSAIMKRPSSCESEHTTTMLMIARNAVVRQANVQAKNRHSGRVLALSHFGPRFASNSSARITFLGH